MEVKDIIKEHRIALDLTMKELAKKIGVSEATISRWESGDIANMKRDKARDLAKALGIPIRVIMEWDETEQEEPIKKEQRELLEMYESLPEDKQALVRNLIKSLKE